MRVVVLGARGMLGTDLVPLLSERHDVVGLGSRDADVTDLPALCRTLEGLRPEVVVNCAAATHVDRCETDPDWAYRVNAWGAWAAAAASEAVGARFLHISTDFVFSGDTDRAYTEWDPPAPVNRYGASKLAGETSVFRACRQVSVVRTQWLYGRHGGSFPRAVLRAARQRPDEGLRVVADQFGAPTYTRHLARKLLWLLEWPANGVYHVNNGGECTRFDWAVALLRTAGFEEVPVTPIRADEWPLPARRPRRSTLRRYALELAGTDDLPPWEEGVREFIQELRDAGEL